MLEKLLLARFIKTFGFDPIRAKQERDDYLKMLEGRWREVERKALIALKPGETIEHGDYTISSENHKFRMLDYPDIGKTLGTQYHKAVFRVLNFGTRTKFIGCEALKPSLRHVPKPDAPDHTNH